MVGWQPQSFQLWKINSNGKWIKAGTGHNRKSNVYTTLEALGKMVLDRLGLTKASHNYKVQVRVRRPSYQQIRQGKPKVTNKITNYWLDYYLGPHGLPVAIEIDPKYHKTYLPYYLDNKIRDRRLREQHGIQTVRIDEKTLITLASLLLPR